MISVIIATFNRAHLISRAIDSVLTQSHQNFEMIIADDGSDDNTEEVVKNYSDSRIKYFKLQKNGGPGRAKNFGVEMASGETITFLDSDDYYENVRVLEKINQKITRADVVAFKKYYIEDDNGRRAEEAKLTGDAYEYLMQHPLHYIGKPPYAMKRNLFLKAGKFNEYPRWGEALGFWRRLFKQKARLELEDGIGYVVCLHAGERVSRGGSVKDRKQGKEMVFNVVFRAYSENGEYFKQNKIPKAIWLVFLLRTSKSMRDVSKFSMILKSLIKNGLINYFKGYVLLKSGKVTEG